MTATYYVTLTDHGSERIAQAHGQAEIVLVNLVLGDANGLPYDPVTKKTRSSLVNQRASVPVQSVVVNGSIARVTATISSSIGGFNIHELGLTDSTGKLVYLGNYHGGFKPVLANGASGELVLLIDIKADAGSQVLIHVDPTVVTANKQWVLDNFVLLTTYNAHVAQNQLEHNNLAALIAAEAHARGQADNQQSAVLAQHISQNQLEHNNLLALINAEIQARQQQASILVEQNYHVGSWHGTNSTSYNPATALKPLFGYETTWYLWPYVPAGVANTSAALGQIIALENGSGTQAMTTRIWQRLPDGASPPTYVLTANQTTVDEGEQITFNLTTTGLAQGTPVAWNMTGIQTADISPNAMSGQFVVGADGKASKTITIVADQVTEGTETLKFALTYITGKFVNVTISDTSIVPEQIVTISSDQLAGLNLRSDFVQLYGQPTSNTKAVFIIESGVTIVGSTPESSAIYGGVWASGSTREIRIMSNALIAGRGGKGGDGGGDFVDGTPWTQQYPAQDGESGGTAIEAETGSPIIVNNYGLIAGGGGGGGAGGGAGTEDNTVRGIGSSAGGGGAPYGLAGLAHHSDYNDYVPAGDRAKSANLTTGGQGGPAYTVPSTAILGTGGAGGNIGQNGVDGGNAQSGSTVHLTPGQIGGLAGYIYQGPVTINNLGSGQTKGRTP